MGLYTPDYIYAARWSTARGWYWKREREVSPETKAQWLAIYRKDEPTVRFELGKKKPQYPAKALHQ